MNPVEFLIYLTIGLLHYPLITESACIQSCAVLDHIVSCREFQADDIRDCYDKNDNVTVLDVSFTAVENITQDMFANLSHTVQLYMDRVTVASIDADALADLDNLETVSLRNIGQDVSKFVPALLNNRHLIQVSLGGNFQECTCPWWDIVKALLQRGIQVPTADDSPICTKDQTLACDFQPTEGSSVTPKPQEVFGKAGVIIVGVSCLTALFVLCGTIWACIYHRNKKHRNGHCSIPMSKSLSPGPNMTSSLKRPKKKSRANKRYFGIESPRTAKTTKDEKKTVRFKTVHEDVQEQITARRHNLGERTDTEDSGTENDKDSKRKCTFF